MPQVIIHAHKGIGLEVDLGGKKVNVPPGGTVEETLTGDHVGTVRAVLEAQAAMLVPQLHGGHVSVHSETGGVPIGSKKWLSLARAGALKPSVDDMRQAAITLKLVGKNDKSSKADLRVKLGLDEEAIAEAAAVVEESKTAAEKAAEKDDKTGPKGKSK